MKKHYLGIDIGGTKIKTVILDDKGTVLERNEVLTEDTSKGKELWKKKMIALIEAKSEQYAKSNPEALKCGISAPGLVDAENKMTLHMPKRLQGIENFNWSEALQRDIRVINDGHSACLAEYESFYSAEGVQNLLMLTLGTGVGGGIIIDGKLYQGTLQRAGHVGHMTVDFRGSQTMTNMPGSLEHAIGNFSVSERTGGRFKSVRELVDAYENQNPEAKTWWLESVQKLAVALASLTNILSPELIILGGGITAGAGNSLMDPLKEFMSDYEWCPGGYQIKIKKAKLGGYAGAIGAAFFAKNKSH
ncbi:ROK family protein [uncultured Kriegella sp.]|uniref:ROK family protein n=1 Tax=uncultured Kriegella sp. TaxID=1798910 RepID=UPI0030D70D93|tara:strand:- start:13100 stop:14011 length:912 start_codon:yes stop_codon:yes gene_type:complete